MVNYSQLIGRALEMMCRGPPWLIPPLAEHRQRLQDGILRIQKVSVVEIVFCGAPGCFRCTWIYIGGRSRSVELRGAHEGGGAPRGVDAPPCLVAASLIA